jgi:DNA-directed RNA polymerase subunit RPC12/RpoP
MILTYKCKNCSGELTWNADKKVFLCEYCGSNFTEAEINSQGSSENLQQDAPSEEKNTGRPQDKNNIPLDNISGYSCKTCGAEIICESTSVSQFCVYCNNPVILTDRISGEFLPEMIIPFELSKDRAVKTFNDWVGKKWFVPKMFKTSHTAEKIKGLYVPFWLLDFTGDADMQAIGENKTTWVSGDYEYTKTDEYTCERRAKLSYLKVPADGSKNIDDSVMEALEPFDYGKLIPFEPAYLSGFYADKYDAEQKDVYPHLYERISKMSKSLLLEDIKGYDSVSVNGFSLEKRSENWTYAMLPVWFTRYSYNGKTYEFAVNAQSGEITGSPPIAYGKLCLWCSFWGLITAALVLLIGLAQ